ncbi:MAG: hypothetical protein Q9222_002236 [Ikaeria aurantiellina]
MLARFGSLDGILRVKIPQVIVTSTDESTVPLLLNQQEEPISSPLTVRNRTVHWAEPLAQPIRDASPTPRATVVQWAPLPRPDRGAPASFTGHVFKTRKTVVVFRRWFKNHADADRAAYWAKIKGEKGKCHFCQECGRKHGGKDGR